jgi:hypothetical protein
MVRSTAILRRENHKNPRNKIRLRHAFSCLGHGFSRKGVKTERFTGPDEGTRERGVFPGLIIRRAWCIGGFTITGLGAASDAVSPGPR